MQTNKNQRKMLNTIEGAKPPTAAPSLETAESAFAGISHLPRVKMDKLKE